jgi:hypothetical protein
MHLAGRNALYDNDQLDKIYQFSILNRRHTTSREIPFTNFNYR